MISPPGRQLCCAWCRQTMDGDDRRGPRKAAEPRRMVSKELLPAVPLALRERDCATHASPCYRSWALVEKKKAQLYCKDYWGSRTIATDSAGLSGMVSIRKTRAATSAPDGQGARVAASKATSSRSPG